MPASKVTNQALCGANAEVEDDAQSWFASFPVDPGSADAFRVDSRWNTWDPREPQVIAVPSLAVAARSYAARRHVEGYANRGTATTSIVGWGLGGGEMAVALVGDVVPTPLLPEDIVNHR